MKPNPRPELAAYIREVDAKLGKPKPAPDDPPYIVDIPVDLHQLWKTCPQDLLDTMPDHLRQRIHDEAENDFVCRGCRR